MKNNTNVFSILLKTELKEWFSKRNIIKNLIIWSLVVNAMLLVMLQTIDKMPEDISPLTTLSQVFIMGYMLFSGIGLVIIMQSSFIEEFDQGTMAWMLSKPISRVSYLLVKFFSVLIPATFYITIVQGILGLTILKLNLPDIAISNFTLIIFCSWTTVVFYLAFSLFISVYTRRSVTSITILIAFVLSQQMVLGLLPFLSSLLPFTQTNVALAMLIGQDFSLPWYSSLILLVESVVLLILSIKKFKEYEF